MEANPPYKDSDEGDWVTNLCWKFEEDLTFHTTWTIFENIGAYKRVRVMQIFDTTYHHYTISNGPFLPFIRNCAWILNDSSIYIDGLATLWENYQVL